MKRTLIAAVLLAGLLALHAQERLPREETLRMAFVVCSDLKELLNTPIPTDPDVKRPVAIRDGDYGGMVLPETKLSADTFATAGEEAKPVGQLWLRGLAPMNEGQVVAQSKLRTVHLRVQDQAAEAVCCALGVAKGADGALALLVYGKDKSPVARVPLKAISGSQDNPIEVSAERKDDSGLITLKFLGKYEAAVSVTAPEN